MKLFKAIVLSLLVFPSSVFLAEAQEGQVKMVDAVHLKSGVILKGRILEKLADKHVTILTMDGDTVTVSMRQIEKIGKLPKTPVKPSGDDDFPFNSNPKIDLPQRPSSFTILAGVSLPIGVFGNAVVDGSHTANALPGGALGAEYRSWIDPQLSWLSTLTLCVNNTDETALSEQHRGARINGAGYWSTFSLISGLEAQATLSQDVAFLFSAQLGFMIGSAPAIRYQELWTSVVRDATTAMDYAFGLGFTAVYRDRISLAVRCLTSAPEYDMNKNTPDDPVHHLAYDEQHLTFRQRTTIVQVMVGWTL